MNGWAIFSSIKQTKNLKRCLFLRLSLHKYTQQFGKDIFITENFSLEKKKPVNIFLGNFDKKDSVIAHLGSFDLKDNIMVQQWSADD